MLEDDFLKNDPVSDLILELNNLNKTLQQTTFEKNRYGSWYD